MKLVMSVLIKRNN